MSLDQQLVDLCFKDKEAVVSLDSVNDLLAKGASAAYEL
jgi:hypothetical protein